MKKIKYIVILLLLLTTAVFGYMINNYYEYESKQEEVREFQKLAFKGYSFRNVGKNDEAIAAYEKALKIHDKETQSLKDLASLYIGKGKYQKAKELYQKAYEANKDNYDTLYNIALSDFILKNYDEVIQTSKNLIHKDKNRLKYYRLLSASHFALGEHEKAFGYYRVLDDKNKYQNDKLLQDVKKQYELLEEKPESLKVIFKYQKTDDIKELENLMLEYQVAKYDIKALRTAQKILMSNKEHNLANKTAAQLLYDHNVLSDAYQYAINITEHDAKSLEVLGAAHQNRQEFEKALEAYEKSYAKKTTKELLRAMTVCAMKAKKVEDMENYIARLNKIDPLLSTQLVYAIETSSGIEHTLWDKLVYLTEVEFYKNYCKIKGCDGA